MAVMFSGWQIGIIYRLVASYAFLCSSVLNMYLLLNILTVEILPSEERKAQTINLKFGDKII